MSALSGTALAVSAISLLILGFFPNRVMNGIADRTIPFLHGAVPEERIRYYSPENLKGSLVSILIGLFVYLLIVRKFLMKDGKYRNVLPETWDLENAFYRPLLQKWLPGILGPVSALFGENKLTAPLFHTSLRLSEKAAVLFGENKLTAAVYKGSVRVTAILSHALSDGTDALILLLRKTVFKDSPAGNAPPETRTLSYRLGLFIDRTAEKRKREKKGEHKNAKLFYRFFYTLHHETHNLTDSLSFALLALCAAVCAVLIYILFVHR